jgi:hypothetical protein
MPVYYNSKAQRLQLTYLVFQTTVFVEPSLFSLVRLLVASFCTYCCCTSHWTCLTFLYATAHSAHELVWLCCKFSTYHQTLAFAHKANPRFTGAATPNGLTVFASHFLGTEKFSRSKFRYSIISNFVVQSATEFLGHGPTRERSGLVAGSRCRKRGFPLEAHAAAPPPVLP